MNQLQSALREASAHLQNGRFADARTALAPHFAAAALPPQGLMIYAIACRMTEADAECERALERLLEIEPRTVRALLMKGDLARDAGDDRRATAFYRRAAAEAQTQPNLPVELRQGLAEAERWIASTDRSREQWLEEALVARGHAPDERSARFRESIDILAGRKPVHLQQPGVYYYPGLAPIPFFEPADFPWVEALERRTPEIRAELERALGDPDRFAPYLLTDPARPPSGAQSLRDNPEWSALYLWRDGAPDPENAARFPATMAALEAAPLARMGKRAPVVMFSLLKAGAHIPPHHGSTNTRLICHLPLVVPDGCALRVGNETRSWREGELLVFDDTIEHEAWNRSGEDRVVLIFDVWRPELGDRERREVAALFEALDSAQAATGQRIEF